MFQMRTLLPLLAIPLSLWAAAPSADPAPVQEYTLHIAGSEHDLVLGEALEVKLGGEVHRVRVDAKPFKSFSHLGVAFRVPSEASYAIDEELPVSYEFELGDASLMLMEYGEVDLEAASEQTIAGMVEMLEAQGAEVETEEITSTFGEEELDGTSVTVLFPMGVTLVQNVYCFASGSTVFALYLHDMRSDQEDPTEDFDRIHDELVDSFSIDAN